MNFDEIQFLAKIDLDHVRALPEYTIAHEIVQDVQAMRIRCLERGQWLSWYDQISRSSTSVMLNIGEAYGKGRGYFYMAFLVARGEAFETAMALDAGPQDLCEPIQSKVATLVKFMNERLLQGIS